MAFLTDPHTIRNLCNQYGLTPSKRYGQHFLISEKPIEKMIEAAELSKNDTVIEIGPGFGVLTLAVAPRVNRVIAFEIERKLAPYWEERLKEQKIERSKDRGEKLEIREKQEIHGNIEIIWGNALKNLQSAISNPQSYKVVANLPYQITSKVLQMFLSDVENKPKRIVVMVQKEVAERIVAKPPDMSVLAVSVQYYGEPRIVEYVPKESFWPEPDVNSAIVSITNIQKATKLQSYEEEERFFRVVKAGFANKRKQLWRNLSVGFGLDAALVKKILSEVMGNEKVRAQELAVEQWKEAVRLLYPQRSP